MNRRDVLKTLFTGGAAVFATKIIPAGFMPEENIKTKDFWADNPPTAKGKECFVFLNGEDVSHNCTMFHGCVKPDVEANGYAEIVIRPLELGNENKAITKRVYGKVEWTFL